MLLEPTCWTRGCKHYTGIKQDNEEEETERNVCKAFPDGIPEKKPMEVIYMKSHYLTRRMI